jgi:hypothetical protein
LSYISIQLQKTTKQGDQSWKKTMLKWGGGDRIDKEKKTGYREFLDSNSPATLLSVNCSVQYWLKAIPYYFMVIFCAILAVNVFAQTNISVANNSISTFTLNESCGDFSTADNNVNVKTINSVTVSSSIQAIDDKNKTFLSTPKSVGECYLSQISNGTSRGATNFNVLWSSNNGGNSGLGLVQLDLSTTFSLLLPIPVSPFFITPSFQATFFDPKTNGYATDKTLYTTGLDFHWIKPIIRNKLMFDLGFAVQYSGDFKVDSGKTLRFPARFMAIWNCKPHLKMIFGLAYLDREDDFNWLPIAGLIWEPREDISVELVIPRAKIAKRVYWFDSAACNDTNTWLYAALEFGSGSWSCEYQGAAANIDYRDLKLLLGGERRCASGITLSLELGYMFERKYELDRLNYNTYPANCVFLRVRFFF